MRAPFLPIPTELVPLYAKLRMTLGIILLFISIGIAYVFLFPTIVTSFDFRNPKSSKNQIFTPRSENGDARTNGKLETNGTFIANTSPLGDFSRLTVGIDLEKRSESPSHIAVTVRKNYNAFLYPIGDPVTEFPSDDVFRIGDTYYALREKILYPFVSEAAFLSRFPKERAIVFDASSSMLKHFSISEEWIGFRIGSLVSFADGIYIVTSETDIRPIGSAEIFLALGFHFEDVIPVSEEDLGIYKRGRIFLMGATHPDGTLFEDRSSGTLYLIDRLARRPVQNTEYREFLLSKVHPILADEPSPATTGHCSAVAGLVPRVFDCDINLTAVASTLGADYEIRLTDNDVDVDIATLSLAFGTRLDIANAKVLVAKVKERILARFGLSSR
ncbi:MAG: hypothetical protein WAT81_04010 [Candidatus Moraniibacteriota bacterium]